MWAAALLPRDFVEATRQVPLLQPELSSLAAPGASRWPPPPRRVLRPVWPHLSAHPDSPVTGVLPLPLTPVIPVLPPSAPGSNHARLWCFQSYPVLPHLPSSHIPAQNTVTCVNGSPSPILQEATRTPPPWEPTYQTRA